MIKKIVEQPEIYSVYIPLPNNPLKNLNCYVMKTDAGNLVVDTGFNQPECFEALTEGLRELNVDMNNTTLFLTHIHSDHTGLIERIRTEKTRVIMGAKDYNYFSRSLSGNVWKLFNQRFIEEGFPESDVYAQEKVNPAVVYALKNLFKAIPINDGESFFIGKYEFECVLTPGHTPGHTCLYLKNEKIMFLGDHVLFDISPNITCWPYVKDSLNDYLTSLDKIATYDIRVALPGHRKNEMDVYERIAQLKKHHAERIESTLDIVKKKEYQNAYEIAGQLKWSLRGKTWAECPIQQKWFAVGETMSHLDYLVERNRIVRIKDQNIFVYRAK
ncbi:MBL fold metallo-hydrolase [Acetobacterium paludosum]|uniref:MBL fold metallo-hydrolase n=1 Tax=Acetobacterium paludosum TaxID=52693 RepID=A0A923HUF7_9FIRM|nr:MBL fold metallo-hydrolase [Acetobacterium paludosum]MBC3888794.1 MBL fold metallo-hydrolase [Acetobacterium paludosum]